VSGQPARNGPRTHADDYALGHAACRQARLHAPTWQEVARAIRPCLPGLPRPAMEACARALLAEAGEISWMAFPPAPYDCRPREEFQRALLTGAYQALRQGEQVAAVCQGSDGIWEVSDVRIPPVYPREQDRVGTAPARRPALRLVGDGHRPPVPGAGIREAMP
jgi:hypothetical protein